MKNKKNKKKIIQKLIKITLKKLKKIIQKITLNIN